MLCTSLALRQDTPTEVHGTVLRCNRWGCDYCAPFKRKALQRLAKAGQPDTFITLTASEATGDDPNQAARALVRAWRLAVKRAKRRFGFKHLPYICVVEATKAGRPHLHILARVRWLPQKWLSETMRELAEAPIVWIERLSVSARIAGYISKYLGKEPHYFHGCKRFWRSLDWIADKEKWKEDNAHGPWAWVRQAYGLSTLVLRLLHQGYAITVERPDYIVAEPP